MHTSGGRSHSTFIHLYNSVDGGWPKGWPKAGEGGVCLLLSHEI